MANGILASALSAANRRLVPARFLASFVGLAQSMYLAVPSARLYLRALHDVISSRWTWESRVRLSKQAVRDLRWWAALSQPSVGASDLEVAVAGGVALSFSDDFCGHC